jgi:uncharacterized damage-inducible protein DinB
MDGSGIYFGDLYPAMEVKMVAEVQSYLEVIDDLRRQVGNLIADLPAEALNWRPIKREEDHATNSLAVLASHVAGSEHFWIAEVVGRYPATRNREAEFITEVTGVGELTPKLATVGMETKAVLSGLQAEDLADTRDVDGRVVSVRWAILHVIEHTALHLGHMQLTYQLWQEGQAMTAPY